MRKRLLRILMSAVIPVALGLSAVGVTSASAGTARAVSPAPVAHSSGMRIAASGFQYCYKVNSPWACLNAWGGGPWVNVYTAGPKYYTPNNFFTIIGINGNYVQIQDTGTQNSWYGKCVGDAYNSSGDARTSLDPCGTGWGTNFTLITCSNNISFAFKNSHWGGYLAPASGWVNGSNFYLNSRTPYCFGQYGPPGG